MDKIAEMTRMAEVRGCLAAFHDAGLIKVASEDAFDGLCAQVADLIGYDYNLEKIAGAADRVLSGVAGAFRGDKVKAGKEMLNKVNKDAFPHTLLGRRAAKQTAEAKKLIRKGRIGQALAYGGAGAAGAAGLAGVGYGANACMKN